MSDSSTTDRYLQNKGVLDNVLKLRSILEARGPQTDRLETFLRVLRETGTDTFVAFELTDGTSLERLRRLNRSILRFEHFGPDVRTILRSSEVWRLNDSIAAARPPLRPAMTVNNLIDAAALAALHQLVLNSKQSADAPMVRFYTTSSSVISAIESNADMFTYELPAVWQREAKWRAGYVFRSTEYYVLRASFEALRFTTLAPAINQNVSFSEQPLPPAITLADLERVWRELTDALTRDDDELAREVEERITIGGRPLWKVIVDIEHASFVERLFNNYHTPPALRSLIDDAVLVFGSDDPAAARTRLRQQIIDEAHEMSAVLEQRLAGLQSWLAIVRNIRKSLRKINGVAGNFDVENPLRDLGMVRWGALVTEQGLGFATTTARALFSADETVVGRATAELAESAFGPHDESGCFATCSVLWMLGLFKDVIDAINRLDDHISSASNKNLPVGLGVMRAAARLRIADKEFSRSEKETHIDLLERLVIATGGQGRLYLGLAYAAYYVARADSEITGNSTTDGSRWSQKSFEWGEHAVSQLVPGELDHAFAINHCAYVGTVFGVFPERTAAYLEQLRQMQMQRAELWHYRFADTIAIADYMSANKKWTEITSYAADTEVTRRLKASACGDIAAARKVLSTAFPYFGDPEIPEHHLDVQRLSIKLGCADEQPSLQIQPHPQ